MSKTCLRIAPLALALGLAGQAAAGEVSGAGASVVHPVMSKWSADYAKASDTRVNYQAIGSGGGIAQVKAGTVDFSAADAPLNAEELAQHGLAQFPAVIGGVVPVVNLPGIEAGAIRLDGATLANIFLSRIKAWNDPAIVALNRHLSLPALPITVVHRADGSATTFNFSNYLSKVSPAWKTTVGDGIAVTWPAGIGGKGNAGVAAQVRQVEGGIGYVDLAYVLRDPIAQVQLRNAAGRFVSASAATVQAAAASADWDRSKDFNLLLTDAPGADAWPIASANFIVMPKQAATHADAARGVQDFFRWAYAHGDLQAQRLAYVPLPDALVSRIERYWAATLAF